MFCQLVFQCLKLIGFAQLAQLSRTRQAQWPRMIQTLLASVLLGGVKPFELDDSCYHSAFKEGLDRPCSTTVSSFLAVCVVSRVIVQMLTSAIAHEELVQSSSLS